MILLFYTCVALMGNGTKSLIQRHTRIEKEDHKEDKCMKKSKSIKLFLLLSTAFFHFFFCLLLKNFTLSYFCFLMLFDFFIHLSSLWSSFSIRVWRWMRDFVQFPISATHYTILLSSTTLKSPLLHSTLVSSSLFDTILLYSTLISSTLFYSILYYSLLFFSLLFSFLFFSFLLSSSSLLSLF